MYVVNKQAPVRGLRAGYYSPTSRTMIFPSSRARVDQAQAAAGNWLQFQPLRGLGAFSASSVPTWVWWGAGATAVGAAAGYFFLRRGKRR